MLATTADPTTNLSAAMLNFWLRKMGKPAWSVTAYRLLVLENTSFDLLIKELASLYFAQLTDKWPIDAMEWAMYTEKRRGDGFVRRFLKYISSNKTYMVERVREDLSKCERTRKYLKHVR